MIEVQRPGRSIANKRRRSIDGEHDDAGGAGKHASKQHKSCTARGSLAYIVTLKVTPEKLVSITRENQPASQSIHWNGVEGITNTDDQLISKVSAKGKEPLRPRRQPPQPFDAIPNDVIIVHGDSSDDEKPYIPAQGSSHKIAGNYIVASGYTSTPCAAYPSPSPASNAGFATSASNLVEYQYPFPAVETEREATDEIQMSIVGPTNRENPSLESKRLIYATLEPSKSVAGAVEASNSREPTLESASINTGTHDPGSKSTALKAAHHRDTLSLSGTQASVTGRSQEQKASVSPRVSISTIPTKAKRLLIRLNTSNAKCRQYVIAGLDSNVGEVFEKVQLRMNQRLDNASIRCLKLGFPTDSADEDPYLIERDDPDTWEIFVDVAKEVEGDKVDVIADVEV